MFERELQAELKSHIQAAYEKIKTERCHGYDTMQSLRADCIRLYGYDPELKGYYMKVK